MLRALQQYGYGLKKYPIRNTKSTSDIAKTKSNTELNALIIGAFFRFKEENKMVKTKFKRAVSLVMAAVLSLGVFANIGTTAYAASGTKSDVYIMELPRSGDTNNNGKWGHGELKFMNGWYSHAISTDSLRASANYSQREYRRTKRRYETLSSRL